MRYFSLILLLFFPNFVFAACSEKGATVVYVNGIFTSEVDARNDLKHLRVEYLKEGGRSDVKFITGYNPSHIEGVGDLYKSIQQVYQGDSLKEDTDFRTILLQIYPEIATQKILLVGHSQGTFYTNKLYSYLIQHGVPKESIGVYNIATPASFVAGDGAYLTSATDKVIQEVRRLIDSAPSTESFAAGPYFAMVQQHYPSAPLPPNVVIALDLEQQKDKHGGHSFGKTYLAQVPHLIIGQIEEDLSKLAATSARSGGECFPAPTESVFYKISLNALGGFDHVATGIKAGGSAVAFSVKIAGAFVADVAHTLPANIAAGVSKIVSDLSVAAGGVRGISHAAEPGKEVTNFKIFKAIYGSSLSESDVQELLGSGQGGAAILALRPKKAPNSIVSDQTAGEVLGAETEPDGVTSSAAAASSGGEATSTPIPQVEILPPPPEPPKAIPGEMVTPHGPPPNPPPTDQPAPPAPQLDLEAATSSPAAPTSTPLVLTPPQGVVFENWRSADDDQYCSVMTRTADLSWDAVAGASGYEIWQHDAQNGERLMVETASTEVPALSFSFGLNWGTAITLSIVATDGAGQYATTTLAANDAVPDTEGPSIVSQTPAYGTNEVPLMPSLSVVFSEALDPSTVSARSFSLSRILYPSPGPAQEPVEVAVSLGGDGKTVTLAPLAALVPDARYNINSSCWVKDLYGNHAGVLSTDSSFNSVSFTTASTTP